MGIVRDLYMARKIGAGLKLPAPTLARLIKRMGYAPKHTPQTYGPAAIVEFTANMERKVKSLVVDISNADGLTGLTVHRTGRNFLRYPYYQTTLTDNGITFTDNGDGSLTLSGTASAVASFVCLSQKPLPNGTYTVRLTTDWTQNNNIYIRCSPTSSTSDFFNVNPNTDGTLTITNNEIYIFRVRVASGMVLSSPVTVYPMIRLATDTDTAWEQYSGSTHTADWTDEAGSITSGTLDVISGELETGGNTYQLTPQEVKTLVGQNYVWSEAGDVTVTV